MSAPIFFDIETKPFADAQLAEAMPAFKAPSNIKDPAKIAAKIAEKEQAFKDKAALSPMSSTVLAVGLWCDDGVKTMLHGEDEPDLIRKTWESLTDHGAFTRNVIGWNVKRFDFPFLIKRSWALGIKLPETALENYRGRYFLNSHIIDMMDFFTMGAEQFASLNSALQLLGLGSKIDTSGKLFYELYDENRELAMEYLKRDITAMVDLNKSFNL